MPADYRAFLGQAGRGGAGPAYGLFPVGRKGDSWRWFGDGASTADDAGFKPVHDSEGAPQTFTRWYRTWLDEAEATVTAP